MGLNEDGQLGHSGHAQSVPVGSPHLALMHMSSHYKHFVSCMPCPMHAQAVKSACGMLFQVPQEVLVPEPVIQVAAGHHHTLFLTQSGDVWACGRNSRGQLGLGSRAGSHVCTPQPLSALAGFDHIDQLCVTLPALQSSRAMPDIQADLSGSSGQQSTMISDVCIINTVATMGALTEHHCFHTFEQETYQQVCCVLYTVSASGAVVPAPADWSRLVSQSILAGTY